jgi:hypothetical protein
MCVKRRGVGRNPAGHSCCAANMEVINRVEVLNKQKKNTQLNENGTCARVPCFVTSFKIILRNVFFAIHLCVLKVLISVYS